MTCLPSDQVHYGYGHTPDQIRIDARAAMPPLVERLIDVMHDVGKAAVLSKATDAEIDWLFCGQNLPPEEEFEAVMAQTMQLLSMTVLGKYREAAQRALRLDEAHINKKK